MILPRRDFLRTSCGLGMGTAAAGWSGLARAAVPATQAVSIVPQLEEYERILATRKSLNVLGCPRSWSIVQQGFLPISPERVLILQPRDTGPSADRWGYSAERGRIRERFNKIGVSTNDYHGERMAAGDNRGAPPDAKLGLILQITKELTRYYSVPEHWEEWAYWMTIREALASTSIGMHVAVPHQWQHYGYYGADNTVKSINTVNAQVDWWLILFPGGTMDWDAWDNLPIHMMLTHVWSSPAAAGPSFIFELMYAVNRGIWYCHRQSPHFAMELSTMDRVSAARLMSRNVVLALPD